MVRGDWDDDCLRCVLPRDALRLPRISPQQEKMMSNLIWGIAVPGAIMIVSFGLTIYLYYRFSKKDPD